MAKPKQERNAADRAKRRTPQDNTPKPAKRQTAQTHGTQRKPPPNK